MDSVTTFISYNSTGLNSVKTKWIRDIINVTNSDFITLQEHFKKTKNIDKYFADEFPDKSPFVIPGHRDIDQESGRAKGGIAMLCSKNKNVKKKRVKTSSYRLQAQVLTFPRTRILWINSYMPTDPQTIQYDNQELLDVLNEIENIMDSEDYDDVAWMGDFNWERTRNSGFSAIMNSFMARIGLVDVWDKYPISYTHIHTDYKSTSTLDRFFVNERLLGCVVDADVVHLGDNPSRHSPIMMKLDIGKIPALSVLPEKVPKRPAWYKANQEHLDMYTNVLDSKITAIPVPDSLQCVDPNFKSRLHSHERDNYMLNILSAIIETSYSHIPLSGGGNRNPDPDKDCPVGKSVPGWRDKVKPFRDDSIFWHGVWQSAGRPNKGALYSVMVRTRNLYHYSVRKVMKQADQIRANNLLEASERGDLDLLREMKKLNNKKSSQKLPETVEDADNPEDIVDKFRSVYAALYNSAPTDIDDLLGNLVVENNALSEVTKVTGAKVKEAACRMKPGKCDVSGGYSSDALLHGPDSLFEGLAAVIRSFLLHGTVTKSLLACAFMPLLKSMKDPAKTDSYRAIAGSSLILKLMDNVILLLWGDMLESDSLQFGFKAKVSTTQCSWLVNEVTSHYIRSGTPVITTLLDCSKAFDKCLFVPLFQKLLDRNLPSIVVRLLIFVYKEQEAWIKWGPLRSEMFSISNGTRQGSVLSPALFAIYLDDLLVELRSYGLGCYMAGLWVGAVGFADDLLLMAPSRSAMAKMLSICERYAAEMNLDFSTDPDPHK